MVPTLHTETNRKNTRPTYAQKIIRKIFCLFSGMQSSNDVLTQQCAEKENDK